MKYSKAQIEEIKSCSHEFLPSFCERWFGISPFKRCKWCGVKYGEYLYPFTIVQENDMRPFIKTPKNK